MKEPLNIAICEDFKKDTVLLKRRIRESGVDAITSCFPNGETFLATFQKGLYHIVFLDIYMGGMTGIKVAEAIRRKDKNVQIVFTTTSQDHALEANRYRSLMYIEKPVALEDVAHCLTITEAVREKKRKDVITLNTADKCQMDVSFDDIIYVEVTDHRCKVITQSETILVVTSTTIEDLAAKLPKPQFLYCHRCYIVNLAKVAHIDGRDFRMEDGSKVYIRVKEFSNVKKVYESYLFALVREGNR